MSDQWGRKNLQYVSVYKVLGWVGIGCYILGGEGGVKYGGWQKWWRVKKLGMLFHSWILIIGGKIGTKGEYNSCSIHIHNSKNLDDYIKHPKKTTIHVWI